MGGLIAFPTLGSYSASKWGLEGFSEALAQELAAFGIRITRVEPGSFATEGGTPPCARSRTPSNDSSRAALAEAGEGYTMGDPVLAGEALLRVIDHPDPPLHAIFGSQAYALVQAAYADRLESFARWEHVARAAGRKGG